MKRRVNDYILDFLASQGVKDVFVLSGGAIAFVIDAFHNRKDIRYICVQHEQAGAMMADAYSRVGPGYAAAMVTSGPGATNLITGICCAWFDSVPAIYISGQVNTHELKGSNRVRQVGFQETEIVDIVKPITKYAVQLTSADDIRYELEKATYIAKSGRPGPVLLDIPMNFQRAEIDPHKLHAFSVPVKKEYTDTGKKLDAKVKKVVTLLQQAKRPVLLVGGGIKMAKAQNEVYELSKRTKFPISASWSGYEIFPRDNPYFIGGHGVYGERAANYTIQNSDVLLSIGSRLDTRQTGGKPDTFARESKVIMVDIDQGELDKRRGLTSHLSIQCDAKEFMQELIRQLHDISLPDCKEWLAQCRAWADRYPIVAAKHYKEKETVNPYVFMKMLSEETPEDTIIISDTGAHLTWTMQAWATKKGQQIISAFGNSPMGYAFPAAIGASIALNRKDIICITGDGSMQINIQELQTIIQYKLPVKIFIINNRGYGIIKQFQNLYLDGHHEATGKGYSAPDFVAIAKAYGVYTVDIQNMKGMDKKIQKVLQYKGPVVVNINIRPGEQLNPKLEYGRPIEDISPLLPREEFYSNMIVKPLEDPELDKKKRISEIN